MTSFLDLVNCVFIFTPMSDDTFKPPSALTALKYLFPHGKEKEMMRRI